MMTGLLSLRSLSLFLFVMSDTLQKECVCSIIVFDAAEDAESTVTQVLRILTDDDIDTCITEQVVNPEFKIDLEENRTITRITVFIGQALSKLIIYGGQSATYQRGNICYEGDLLQTGTPGNELTCTSVISGRYIYGRLYLTGIVKLCEIKAYTATEQSNVASNTDVILLGTRWARNINQFMRCTTYRARNITILIHLPRSVRVNSFRCAISYGDATARIIIFDDLEREAGTCKSSVRMTWRPEGEAQRIVCDRILNGSNTKFMLNVTSNRIKICRIQVVHVIDGGWSNYTAREPCSVSCGGGTQLVTRRCDNPRPQGRGSLCVGGYSTRLLCNVHSCVGDWISWNSWTACSVTCGNGTRNRSRECVNLVTPADVNCTGPASVTSQCAISCPVHDYDKASTMTPEYTLAWSTIDWLYIVVSIAGILFLISFITAFAIMQRRRKKKSSILMKKKRKRKSIKSVGKGTGLSKRKSTMSSMEERKGSVTLSRRTSSIGEKPLKASPSVTNLPIRKKSVMSDTLR